jgi:hypothetical protein
LSAFKQFRAGQNFAKYILGNDDGKQVVSTTWLLSLLDFASIELGGFDHNDEKPYYDDRFAADIIACSVDRQIFLAVDCNCNVKEANTSLHK